MTGKNILTVMDLEGYQLVIEDARKAGKELQLGENGNTVWFGLKEQTRDEAGGYEATRVTNYLDLNEAINQGSNFYYTEEEAIEAIQNGIIPVELAGAVLWQVSEKGINGIAII